MRPLVLLCVLAVPASGCSAFFPTDCPASEEPAVVVDVVDTQTGAPAADGATGTLTDGAYVDSLVVYGTDSNGDALSLSGAVERAGTYNVRVEKAGYRAWTRTGVAVAAGECGPATVRLTARMERL